jgi:hypothetical protein
MKRFELFTPRSAEGAEHPRMSLSSALANPPLEEDARSEIANELQIRTCIEPFSGESPFTDLLLVR